MKSCQPSSDSRRKWIIAPGSGNTGKPGFESGKHRYVPIPAKIAEPRASGAKFLGANLSWALPFIPALWPGKLFNTLGPHFFIYNMGLIMPNDLKGCED